MPAASLATAGDGFGFDSLETGSAGDVAGAGLAGAAGSGAAGSPSNPAGT